MDKAKFESVLAPIAKRIPLSPNVITVLAVVVMAFAAWSILQSDFITAIILVAMSGFLDVLDGTVAKSKNKSTAFGALLDRVADRAADALIFGSIILAGLVQLWLGLAVLTLVLLGSYVSVCIEAATKTKIGEKLSMRAVRFVLLVVGLLLYVANAFAAPNFGGLSSYMDYVFAVIGLLTFFAIIQRMVVAHRIVR